MIKDKNYYNVAIPYLNDVKQLVYNFSLVIAGYFENKIGFNIYSPKTEKSLEFKFVKKTFINLAKLSIKNNHNTFGKHQEKRLYNLGYYIAKNIYKQLGIGFYDYKNKIYLKVV